MTRIINLMTFPFKYKGYTYVQLNSFFLACQDNIKVYCEYEHSNTKSNLKPTSSNTLFLSTFWTAMFWGLSRFDRHPSVDVQQ